MDGHAWAEAIQWTLILLCFNKVILTPLIDSMRRQ